MEGAARRAGGRSRRAGARDHLEGVERTSAWSLGKRHERARGVAWGGHAADDLAGQALDRGVFGQAVGVCSAMGISTLLDDGAPDDLRVVAHAETRVA